MALKRTYTAETWEAIHTAYEGVRFSTFDMDSIVEAVTAYLREYYPEDFTDYITSSELMLMVRAFAYVAELMAYRIDVVGAESTLQTAQRKQSVLRIAKMLSYSASRNVAGRGIARIESVRTTAELYDSLNNNLQNRTIIWADTSNPNWREQFMIVMGSLLTTKIGSPLKSTVVGGVEMGIYTLSNNLTDFNEGVHAFSVASDTLTLPFEAVPADIDTQVGIVERSPDPDAQFSIAYFDDGRGDLSPYTGFMLYLKQGTLFRFDSTITAAVPNRTVTYTTPNINNTDVWVAQTDANGSITDRWEQVQSKRTSSNIYFNDGASGKSFEVESLENDAVAIHFGDGIFSEIAYGKFSTWMRSSFNGSYSVPPSLITNKMLEFTHTTASSTASAKLGFSLISTINNAAPSETIEHIKDAAPATYFTQDRMVNAQDYNTFPLRDSSILKVRTVNRTFTGQSKFLKWGDASDAYQVTKVFGDDLTIENKVGFGMVENIESTRKTVDGVLEPYLEDNAVAAFVLNQSLSQPFGSAIVSPVRRSFVEKSEKRYRTLAGEFIYADDPILAGRLLEKTRIQGVLDQHWYGEPTSFENDEFGTTYAVVDGDSDGRIWLADIPRKITAGASTVDFVVGDSGAGYQACEVQSTFGIRYNRFMRMVGDTQISSLSFSGSGSDTFTIEKTADAHTFAVRSASAGFLGAYSLAKGGDSTAQIPACKLSFTLTATQTHEGDAYIVDVVNGVVSVRSIMGVQAVNLLGYFDIIKMADLPAEITSENGLNEGLGGVFSVEESSPYSWLFIVKSIAGASGGVERIVVFNRFMHQVARSSTTNFWVNTSDKLIDPTTMEPVHDSIKLLKTNLDGGGAMLTKPLVFDITGIATDINGNTDFHAVHIAPKGIVRGAASSTGGTLLDLKSFIGNKEVVQVVDSTTGAIVYETEVFTKTDGDLSFDYNGTQTTLQRIGASNGFSGQGMLAWTTSKVGGDLAFMWAHYSPDTHLVDPSTSNIHDMYVLPAAFYNDTMSFVRGTTTTEPDELTTFSLRASYGYLLANKVISDTVVLRPARIKLLFGSKAKQDVRARFKVVLNGSSRKPAELVKAELVAAVNEYFDIKGWDFGQSLYTTDLIAFLHTKLGSAILSVVIVPTYATQRYGDLTTIEAAEDEILQPCATVDDVAVVSALTSAILRRV